MDVLGFTGHRPKSLGGYNPNNPLRQAVRAAIKRELRRNRPDKVIVGMAIGADFDIAEICIELEIPFIAAVPFAGQEARWKDADKEKYNYLLSRACETHIVCQGGYAAWKMMERNKWIVNHCTRLLAVFTGDKKSGTYQCMKYAHSQEMPTRIIIPERMLVVDIREHVATTIFGIFEPDAPTDLDKAQELLEKEQDQKEKWLEYADSLIEQLNNSGIVLLDRNDAAELSVISQRIANQLEGE